MSQLIVEVEQGKLQGKKGTNIDGGTFYSFQGIPYAKPPLNQLRFKAPQPPEPWSGIRDATKEGSPCYARDMIMKQNIIGSEDCLFLNVYTPQLSNESKILKPVMVWIHGGAFKNGSGSSDLYDPAYLLTEDIVLVTINYRLGILGFLSFEDASLGVFGNAALKDMVMALKWVQQNIKQFGGDPNNVTIFGESAGAASVHYLVLSPAAKGLFHRAIAQSGSALNTFALGRPNISSELAAALKLSTANEKEILQQLIALPVEKVFEISEKVLELCGNATVPSEKTLFAPVVEKPNPEAFITEEPLKLVRSGNYNKVPLLFGFTSREGMLIEIVIRPREPEMPRNFEVLVPHTLQVERGTEAYKTIANKIKDFYYGKPGSEKDVDNFYLIHSDNYFIREIIYSVRFHAETSPFPVYLYRMSVESSLNMFKMIGNIKAPGVAHGDDIGYLFKTKVSPPLTPGSLEETSVKRFVKFWTNFARNGNPNSKDDLISVEWKAVKKDELHYLDIGKELTTGINPEADRLKFWENIFSINPLYS